MGSELQLKCSRCGTWCMELICDDCEEYVTVTPAGIYVPAEKVVYIPEDLVIVSWNKKLAVEARERNLERN